MSKVYNALPSIVQTCAVSLYGYMNDKKRYGACFREKLECYTRNDLLAPAELRKVQSCLLSDFLRHSNESVFWRRRFHKYEVDLDGDPTIEIKKLPILTKAEVRANIDDILISVPALRRKSTSGSTGTGLVFYGTEESESAQWAVWWRYWGRLGIRRGTWCAHFGGKLVVPRRSKAPPYFRYNLASKQMMFSSYHLSEDTVCHYVEALNEKKPRWLHGYASVISELARLAIKKDIHLDYAVDCITLGSENVTSTHERVIFEFFGVKPMQHYGLAEGVANFSNRPGKVGFSVDEDFAFVEFLPMGNQFKVVGTNFTNYAFPLIRYDTGDLVSKVDDSVFPRVVGSVDGRQDDYIVLPTGEKIGRVASVFNEFDFIDESQLVQKELSSVAVRMVVNSRWDSSCEKLVRRALREKLGQDICIDFEYVDAVQRTASGKVRFVISEV